MTEIIPKNDGIDHLNVYAMARTEFGRFFSNMKDAPISIPYVGEFRTIEGLWHYLGYNDESYRTISGFEVKKLANKREDQIHLPDPIFKLMIRLAVIQKAKRYGGLDLCRQPEFKDLPLKHYLVYGNPEIENKYKVVDLTEEYSWWLDIINDIREKANK